MKRRFEYRCAIALLLAACAGASSTRPVLEAPATQKTPPSAPAAEDQPSTGDPWKDRGDLLQPPPPAPPSPVGLPAIDRFTLPNGLRVLVVPAHELPIINMHLAVGAGGIDEPRGKRSLSDFAAEMLTKGTAKLRAEEIAQAMDFIGGSLQATADLESTHVVCQVLAKDLGTCLTLLPEVVIRPSFPKGEMKLVGDQLNAALKQQRDDPAALAAIHLLNLFWGDGHVRGWPHTGEQLASITQNDLMAWHRSRFVPGNAVLVVAGDVETAQLRVELERAFAGWRRGSVPVAKKLTEPKLHGLAIRLVDKPDATQAQLAIGGLGVAHRDPDYLATAVMNWTLGGGSFASRLLTTVRVQGGKSYGASSELERWHTRGMLLVRTFTRTAETVPTLRLVLGELARMQSGGPTEDEVSAAKVSLAGRYPLAFQTVADVAGAVLAAELHGLDEKRVRGFPLEVAAVTLEQAKAAAKSHVDPNNLAIVIVGNATEIGPELERAGMAYERVGWLEPVSVKDRALPAKPSDPKKTEEGKRLLEAAAAFKGGVDKLRSIKDLRFSGRIQLELGGQSVEGEWMRVLVPPDKMRVEIKLGEQRIVMTIAGDAVWQTVGTEVRALPEELASAARAGLWRDRDLVLLHAAEPGVTIQSGGREKLGELSAETVVLRTPDGHETKLFFESKTHQITRIAYSEGGHPASEDYGDYRNVSGLWFPFRQRAQGGAQSYYVTVTDVQVNAGVPAALFDLPGSRPSK